MSSLSSTRVLRHSLRRAARCTRSATTQASSSAPQSAAASTSQTKLNTQSSAELPEDKMRVLVNLYHQSVSFITKENLSKRIDEAFITRGLENPTALGEETPFRALEVALAQRRALPRFGESMSALARPSRKEGRSGEAWSDFRPARELAVMTTLYGVLSQGRPAYDTLKDEEERVKRNLKEEGKSSEGSS